MLGPAAPGIPRPPGGISGISAQKSLASPTASAGSRRRDARPHRLFERIDRFDHDVGRLDARVARLVRPGVDVIGPERIVRPLDRERIVRPLEQSRIVVVVGHRIARQRSAAVE